MRAGSRKRSAMRAAPRKKADGITWQTRLSDARGDGGFVRRLASTMRKRTQKILRTMKTVVDTIDHNMFEVIEWLI
jgi:hypothetical protein